MKKVLNYILYIIFWIFDLGLATLLVFRSRTLILDLLFLFGDPTNWHYIQVINMIDRFLVVILGISWLIFMIVVEEYFRTGVPGGTLLKRFAKITAPLLLILSAIDLLLVFVQGAGKAGWLQWLALLVELGAGIILLMFYKNRFTPKST
jgi:hypothetical protein